MSDELKFLVEVRQEHLRGFERDDDVAPEAWSDALHELLGREVCSTYDDLSDALSVARRLRDVVGIPKVDIRIVQVVRSIVSLEEPDETETGAGQVLRLYRWRSEALMNYGYGHAFALGSSVDEARSAAMAAYKAHLSSDEWWGNGPDEQGNFYFDEDREDYEAAIAKFTADLNADPIAVGDAFVVRGSE